MDTPASITPDSDGGLYGPPLEPPTRGSSFKLAHADRPKRLGRQIDGIPSVGALRLVNGLESAVRRRVGGISRWRQRRNANCEPQTSSDHHLTDIGLDRSQIFSMVEEIIEIGNQPA